MAEGRLPRGGDTAWLKVSQVQKVGVLGHLRPKPRIGSLREGVKGQVKATEPHLPLADVHMEPMQL